MENPEGEKPWELADSELLYYINRGYNILAGNNAELVFVFPIGTHTLALT